VNVDSASGEDEISYLMLTNSEPRFRKALIDVYNESWKQSTFPKIWKKSIITPVNKPNKPPERLSSYRPISLLPVLGKIMEKMIKKRLEWFCEYNGLFPQQQCGFRKGFNPIDCILVLEEAIKNAKSQKKVLVAAFVDFESAFDKILEKKLCQILKTMDFPDKFIYFISDFLNNRTFKVKINEATSPICRLHQGLPQGSPLSPLLFLLFLSELEFSSESLGLAAFADDLTIWEVGYSNNEAIGKLNAALNELVRFSKAFGMSVSAQKTKAMMFNNKNISTPMAQIIIGGERLDLVKECRLLGLKIDHQWTWNKQVEVMKEVCLKRIVILKRLASTKWGNSPTVLGTFYKQYIRPKMEYGIVAYGHTNKKNMLKLETIQNMALRLALGLYPHTSSDRTRKLAGVVPISERTAKATVKYYTRIQSYGEQHPIFTLCIGSARQQNKIGIASWQAFSALCPNWSLDKIQLDSFKFPPPWQFCQPNVCLKLIQDTKENIPHQLIMALKAVKNKPPHFSKVAIFSDSQTAFKLMKTLTWNAKDTDLQELREQLDSIEVASQHIPSHVGITITKKLTFLPQRLQSLSTHNLLKILQSHLEMQLETVILIESLLVLSFQFSKSLK
jgi:hypothetical protein